MAEPLFVHRRRRNQHHAEQRAHPDQSQAARRAERRAPRDHPPPAARARERRGHHPLHAAGAGPDRREPREPHPVPVHARGRRTPPSSPSGRPRLVEKLRDAAGAARRGERPAGAAGSRPSLVIDRDTASRLGVQPQAIDDTLYDAFGQRQVSTIFTQLNQYHVVLEVDPHFQQDPGGAQARSTSARPTATPGAAERLHPLRDRAAPLAINHQGQFPAVTLSFNLAPGVSLGHAVARDPRRGARDRPAAQHPRELPGHGAAFQASLASEPLLILAALVTVYIVLGVLYESYIHPVTILSTLPSAGVGALLALLICRTDFSVIALIGIILLIGIVKKNAIMMIDFALEAEREEGKPPARVDLPGLPAALPAHHDDDDGGAPRRPAAGPGHGHRHRAAPAARHHDRRRPAPVASSSRSTRRPSSTSPSTAWPGALSRPGRQRAPGRAAPPAPSATSRPRRMNISEPVHPPARRARRS